MRFILILLVWCVGATSAFGNWVEARSDNFVFVGDTSEKRAKLIVGELEEYRAIIFNLFGWGEQTELIPVQVYAARSDKDIKKITGNTWAAGIYTTSHEGPVIIANVKGRFGKDSQARNTVYHEYTHHLISMYNNTIFPQWYNEGIAEYLSTFDVNKNGVVKIGLPNNGRGYALSNPKWMDMSVIMNSIRRYPFRNTGGKSNQAIGQYYAQSWLATHYIQSTEGYPDKIRHYLKLINSNTKPEKAFEDSFGMTPEAFQNVLKAYYKKNRFTALSLTLKDGYEPVIVTTRKLSKGETEFHRGEAIRRYRRNSEGYKLADESYVKAIANDGPIAQIKASRALIALSQEKEEEARRFAQQALEIAPNDSRILQVSGHVTLHTFKDTGSQDSKQQISTARKTLKKAMKLKPDNIQAHFDYVSTYFVKPDKLSKQAIFSAEECVLYYKGRNFVDNNLPVVKVLLNADKPDLARRVLEQTRVWSESPHNRSLAERELSMMRK